VNIVVFDPLELSGPIPRKDERVEHILRVLKKGIGDEFFAGTEDGHLGTGRLAEINKDSVKIDFTQVGISNELAPLTLILGFPRPIQANRILKDLTTMGVSRMLLCGTELGEKSYRDGSFYSDQGWKRAVREGASQAGNPRLPSVSTHHSLETALAQLAAADSIKIALDPVEPDGSLSSLSLDPAEARAKGVILAIGSERGWTAHERQLLRDAGYYVASLGSRILRTETACLAAVTLSLSKMGMI
jgi:RsmE family RNA methyltransferase